MPSIQLLAIYPQVKRRGGGGVLQPLSKGCDLRLKKGGSRYQEKRGKITKKQKNKTNLKLSKKVKC